MLKISHKIIIQDNEIEIQAVRAQGAGGQNINKVSTAVHLRFDILASSLPDFYKEKLFFRNDHRISKQGILVIKAQKYRSQEKNREDALNRLRTIIKSVSVVRKKRITTKPTRSSDIKRMEGKIKRGQLKTLRKKVDYQKFQQQ